MSYQLPGYLEALVQETVCHDREHAVEKRAPHRNYPTRVFLDVPGTWCCLYGENLQNGVAGFGASPYLACAAFDEEWTKVRVSATDTRARGEDA